MEAAAEEDRGEEPVLAVADPVTDDADEPEEGDPCERQQIEADKAGSRVRTAQVRHHLFRVERDTHHLGEEVEREDEQDGEDDARDPGGSRRGQTALARAREPRRGIERRPRGRRSIPMSVGHLLPRHVHAQSASESWIRSPLTSTVTSCRVPVNLNGLG